MDHKEFKDWYKEFSGRITGSRAPKDMDKWLDTIDANHERIRKLLGGDRLERTVSITFKSSALSGAECSDLYYKIYDILPNYFYTYNIGAYDLGSPVLISQRGIKTSKHILTYAKKQGITKERMADLEKIIASLGEKWANSKSTETTKVVSISTTPKAFCLIGKYGCDAGSCFAQGCFNQDKRYTFGAHPETFVVVIKKDNNNDDVEGKDSSKNMVRMLGFLTKDNIFNTLSYSGQGSYYCSRKDGEVVPGDVSNLIGKVVSDIMGIDKEFFDVVTNKVSMRGGGLYGHTPSFTYFDSRKHHKIEAQILTAKEPWPLEMK